MLFRSEEATAGGEEEGTAAGEAIRPAEVGEPQADLSNHLADERSAERGGGTVPENGGQEGGEASEEGAPGQDHDITLFVKVNLASRNSRDAPSQHPQSCLFRSDPRGTLRDHALGAQWSPSPLSAGARQDSLRFKEKS